MLRNENFLIWWGLESTYSRIHSFMQTNQTILFLIGTFSHIKNTAVFNSNFSAQKKRSRRGRKWRRKKRRSVKKELKKGTIQQCHYPLTLRLSFHLLEHLAINYNPRKEIIILKEKDILSHHFVISKM